MLSRRNFVSLSALLFITPIQLEAVKKPTQDCILMNVAKYDFPNIKMSEKSAILTEDGCEYIVPFFKCENIAQYRKDFRDSLDFEVEKLVWLSNGDKHGLIAFSKNVT